MWLVWSCWLQSLWKEGRQCADYSALSGKIFRGVILEKEKVEMKALRLGESRGRRSDERGMNSICTEMRAQRAGVHHRVNSKGNQ